jgi:uracil-DNA glycosylase
MNQDLSNLISDVREQVLYLQELGVDSLDCEFQISDFRVESRESRVESQQVQIQSPKIERFIPENPFIKKEETPKPQIEPPKTDTGRLSRIPSLQNRVSPPILPIQENLPPKNITETMPKKETPNESVLFDIRQKLPEANETVAEIQAEIGNCQRCDLCKVRTNIAHSKGNLNADLMFIGEAPGADEDAQGEPFVGRAGQLLTKIIEAIGIKREDVFIGNINRCRPPANRQPTPIESATCKPYLFREIAVVKPKVIVVLGNTACQNLLETKVGITKLRGEFHDYFGVKVMPTFHPAYLLRDPHKKREVWEDMKKVRDYLNDVS